jgi:hypothetical protein
MVVVGKGKTNQNNSKSATFLSANIQMVFSMATDA